MERVLYKILWSTIEDYVGLWEIVWELNSLFPENAVAQNEIVAKKILRYFLDNKLINLYSSVWGIDEIKEIDYSKSVEIIDEEIFWNAPSLGDLCVKAGNTEKGEEVYNKKLLEAPNF